MPDVNPRLEAPTFRRLLEGVFVAAFPMNNVAVFCRLVRDSKQRRLRFRTAWRGCDHVADHDVILRIRPRRSAGILPATARKAQSFTATEPDLGFAPLRRHTKRGIVGKE